MSSSNQDVNVKVIGQNYRLCKKIDEGAFGKIYKAVSIKNPKYQYAVKIQPLKAQYPQLIGQCKLYYYLHNDPHAFERGIPGVFQCGVQGEYNYLVMQLMGPSLQTLLNQNKRRLSLKTTLMLLDQMISNIQYFHSRGYIHRDIKPDNYCMGIGKAQNFLHLLDLGLAKVYKTKNDKHIPYREGKSLTGTARYASVNTHNGCQQSRRDDMESIGYVVIYLARGILPWQGQKVGNKQDKYQKIKQTKINTSIEALCKTFPDQFRIYMQSVRGLKFTEQPQYQSYRKMFRALFDRLGYKMDFQYDWTIPESKQSKQSKQTKDSNKCQPQQKYNCIV